MRTSWPSTRVPLDDSVDARVHDYAERRVVSPATHVHRIVTDKIPDQSSPQV